MSGTPAPDVSAAWRPVGPLSLVVDVIWFHATATPGAGSERVMPRASTDLILDLDHGCATVVGPRTRPVTVDTTGRRHTLGVVLRPGGAPWLLGVPTSEIAGQQISLSALWGDRGAAVCERVIAAGDPSQKLAAMERALSSRLTSASRPAHPAVTRAVADIGAAPQRCGIAGLSDALGISRRRFEEIFRMSVGLTPKAYQRLERFRRTLGDLHRSANVDRASFAIDHGYYDQSHFTNEFRTHAGVSPTEYLTRRGPFVNHVPVLPAP